MKLSKDVCVNCFESIGWKWKGSDNREWEKDQLVFCPPELDEESGRYWPNHINDEPPSFCPFLKQHSKNSKRA